MEENKNIDIQLKEAGRRYLQNENGVDFISNPENFDTYHAFVTGATSTYAEKQKLKFAIEQLKHTYSSMSLFEINISDNTHQHLYYKIQDLKQQLNNL